jgi:DivIVA domain-containing protein
MPDDASLTPDDLRRAVFREAFRGYHPGRVDGLLERAASDLEAGRPLDWLAGAGKLRRCFRGYQRTEVDRLVERLRSSAAARPAPTPTPTPTPTQAPAPTPAPSDSATD